MNDKISVNGNANLIWNNFGSSPDHQAEDTGFYSTVNANVVWQPHERLEVVFSANNLLDQRKRIPPFFLPNVTLFAFLAERNYNINLGYRF